MTKQSKLWSQKATNIHYGFRLTINCREEEEARFGGKESKKVGEGDKDTGKGKSFDIQNSIFSILGRFCIEILCFFQQYSILKRYESSVSDREQHDTVRKQSIVKRQFTPRVVKILLTAKMSTSFMTIYACVPECNGASENSENDVGAQLLIYRREKDWTHHPVVFNGETINLMSQKLYC